MSSTAAHTFVVPRGSSAADSPRAAHTWQILKAESSAFWRMLSDASGELNRAASDFDAIEPANARRLRKAARHTWGWDL